MKRVRLQHLKQAKYELKIIRKQHEKVLKDTMKKIRIKFWRAEGHLVIKIKIMLKINNINNLSRL